MLAAPAGLTQAGVSMFSFVGQRGHTGSFVLTLMPVAADQSHVTVSTAPRLLARICCWTVTPVGVDSIFARGAVLARAAVTLVYVHLTMHAWVEKINTRLGFELGLQDVVSGWLGVV